MKSPLIEQALYGQPTQTEINELDDYLFKQRYADSVERDIYTIETVGYEAAARLITCELPAGAPPIRSGINSEVVGDTIGRFAPGSRDTTRLDKLYHELTPKEYEVSLDRESIHLNLGTRAVEISLPLVTFTKH